MNISYLKNKNIHFVECENWHDAYGYEKSEMKEDTINYIEKLQQENKQLKEKLDKYENPEDMTLYSMWCTEKVKDENKQLKDNWNELKEWIKVRDNIGLEKIWLEDIVYKIAELEKGRGQV